MVFEGCDAETLLIAMDLEGLCASAGSACHSGSTRPSGVLLAMGLSDADARATIRFSLGWTSTDADVDACARARAAARRAGAARGPRAEIRGRSLRAEQAANDRRDRERRPDGRVVARRDLRRERGGGRGSGPPGRARGSGGPSRRARTGARREARTARAASRCRIRWPTSFTSRPGNAGSFVSSSKNTAPSAKMSLRAVGGSPRICSGARYWIFPNAPRHRAGARRAGRERHPEVAELDLAEPRDEDVRRGDVAVHDPERPSAPRPSPSCAWASASDTTCAT